MNEMCVGVCVKSYDFYNNVASKQIDEPPKIKIATIRNQEVFSQFLINSAGLFAYHVYLINSTFSRIVETQVLDCKNRPDYIYINYSIYKESLQKLQRRQEVNKVG